MQNQLTLLHDLLDEQVTFKSVSMNEYRQIKKLVQTIISNEEMDSHLLTVLPEIFITVFKGKHIDFKEVTILKAKRIEVISNCPLPYQVDGEVGTALNCKIAKKPFPLKVKGA